MVFNAGTLEKLDGLEAEPGVPLIEELIKIFIEGSPPDIAAIVQAAQKGDFSAAERIGHAMKSSTASMGLEDLSAIFADIESSANTKNRVSLQPLAANLELEFQKAVKALTDFISENR